MIQLLLFTIIWQPVKVDKFILDNGLTLLVYEDHFAPVVSAQIHYRVGAYDEPKGLTGISHLLEHMAFKGTKKYGPKVYDRTIHEAGGEENGFTSNHVTAYFANLHKDRYAIELEFEADRMTNLLLDPKEFEPEKHVVMEERRLNDNDPYGSFDELLGLLTYTYSPYRNPVVGFMSDLERITLADVKSWYRRYYNPANAIVVVAGDVRAADVRLLVNKLFGKMKGALARPDSFVEPPQQGERRFEYRKDVRMPAIGIQYQTVSVLDPDAYALNLIAMILSQGRSSRFQRETVREKNLAADIYAYSATAKYGGTFIAFGIPQAGVDVKTLETEIENQMERLKTEKVAAEELDKAKRLVMAQTIYRQDAPTGIGFTIANWENTTGDWNNINRFPEEIQKVTADDIQRIARKYLIKENRTVGYLLPSERSEEK
jgi:zinc protease